MGGAPGAAPPVTAPSAAEDADYGLIDAESWAAPVAMAWENWFEENAMTYDEFVAADGVYSLHLFGITSPAA